MHGTENSVSLDKVEVDKFYEALKCAFPTGIVGLYSKHRDEKAVEVFNTFNEDLRVAMVQVLADMGLLWIIKQRLYDNGDSSWKISRTEDIVWKDPNPEDPIVKEATYDQWAYEFTKNIKVNPR